LSAPVSSHKRIADARRSGSSKRREGKRRMRFTPKAGDIGEDQEEYEFEPLTEPSSVPEPEYAPVEVPEPEKVPA
jgi:hypothetical protein